MRIIFVNNYHVNHNIPELLLFSPYIVKLREALELIRS